MSLQSVENKKLVSGKLKKTCTSNLEALTGPTVWSRDTGQQIPCFDSCQLTTTRMCNIRWQATPLARKCTISHWFPCGAVGQVDVWSHDYQNLYNYHGIWPYQTLLFPTPKALPHLGLHFHHHHHHRHHHLHPPHHHHQQIQINLTFS